MRVHHRWSQRNIPHMQRLDHAPLCFLTTCISDVLQISSPCSRWLLLVSRRISVTKANVREGGDARKAPRRSRASHEQVASYHEHVASYHEHVHYHARADVLTRGSRILSRADVLTGGSYVLSRACVSTRGCHILSQAYVWTGGSYVLSRACVSTRGCHIL